MTATTLDTLCPGCFADKGRTDLCRPHCGYDERAERGPLILPHRARLHGQYLVGRVLGKPGGFGITYLGWDLNLQTRVAIKEFLPRDLAGRSGDRATVAVHSQDDGDQFRFGLEQFLREARTLAQLDHPNIVRVRHFFEANGTAYLVMDYYQGLSLAEYLDQQGGRIAEEPAKQLMLPILDGLRAVHAKGFLHRDLKPQNIYLAGLDSGAVRPILLDFGTARQAMGERSRSLSVVVTPGYAPFEQYHRKGKQGPWTDIYSAAAILYRMVTGETPPEATERMADDAIKPATDFGVTSAMSQAIAEGLALTPEARPQSAHDLQTRLWGGGTLPHHAPHPTSDTLPPTLPSPELRSSRWLPALFGVGLVLLGLVAWDQYRGNQIEAGLRQSPDDHAFEAAMRTNTEAAYRAYLSACAAAGCGHRALVEQHLSILAAETALESEVTPLAEVDTAVTQAVPASVPPPPEPIRAQVGHLQISVNIPAQVQLHGRLAGNAAPGQPLNLSDLDVGEHRVTVGAEGYTAQQRTTRVEPGRWTQEVVTLMPEQAPRPTEIPFTKSSGAVGGDKPGLNRDTSSPSFHCGGRLQPVEFIICNDAQLAKADGVMGGIYKDLRTTLGGADADALRTAQRAWIKRRDRLCPTNASDRDSVPQREHAVECLRRVTDERIAELRALLQSVSRR